jgi:hypothetical protein
MIKRLIATTLVPISAIIAASLFASSHPDTLEAVAEKYGFDGLAKGINSLFTDYTFPLVSNEFLSSFLAGTAGLVLLFILYKGLFFSARYFTK